MNLGALVTSLCAFLSLFIVWVGVFEEGSSGAHFLFLALMIYTTFLLYAVISLEARMNAQEAQKTVKEGD